MNKDNLNYTYFTAVQAGFICLTILCLFLILLAARKVYGKQGLSPAISRARLLKISIPLFAWILLVSVLSLLGIFSDFSVFPPRLFIVLLVPLASIILLLFSKKFGAFLQQVPGEWLIYIQFFRVPVEILLWLLFLDNITPVQMTFEGRNMDILTGITAPLAAFLYQRFAGWRRFIVITWNLSGLATLINILVIAILSLPTPLRVFMNEPANTAVTYFPVIWLPAALVPLAYSMHLFSLKKEFQKAK